jgi:hypothetical protein
MGELSTSYPDLSKILATFKLVLKNLFDEIPKTHKLEHQSFLEKISSLK